MRNPCTPSVAQVREPRQGLDTIGDDAHAEVLGKGYLRGDQRGAAGIEVLMKLRSILSSSKS
jgi:hypothetical protein